MQRDVEPDDLDWVFCFGTRLGAVHDRARWGSMNGQPVPYQPHTHGPDQGVRYVVRGRIRTCPLPPVGPRLDQQGMFSRLACWVAGYVTDGTIIPARDLAELEALRVRAAAVVREGLATEWALAAISVGGREQWGLSLAGPEALLAEIAAHVDAPFQLRLDGGGRYTTPTKLDCIGSRDEGVIASHLVDALFDAADPPAFVEDWLTQGAILPVPKPSGRAHSIHVPHDRPTGPGAWTRWVPEEIPASPGPQDEGPERP
jgi:hypothetical protein